MNRIAERWEFMLALVFVLGLPVIIALGFDEVAAIAMSLIWGWLAFLIRVWPQIHVRWDGVLFFLIGLTVVLGCAHSFLRWLVRNRAEARNEPRAEWRFRSTLSLVALFLMMFVVGISLTGTMHQVGWLMNSRAPLFASKIQSLEDNARSTYRIGVVDPHPGRSWIEAVLPYASYVAPPTDYRLPWNDPRNAKPYETLVPSMLNPSGRLPLKSPDGFGLSHFAGNAHIFESNMPVRMSDSDRAATLLIGEVNTGLVPWPRPDNSRDPTRGLRSKWKSGSGRELGFGSPASQFGSTLFALMDGSVRPVDNQIDPKVLRQLSELGGSNEP